MKEILMLSYRSIILFAVSLFLVRFMGKRTIAQLSPFDLIVVIIMGSAIAIPLEDDKIKLTYGIVPVIIMSALNYGLSLIITKNRKLENFFQGTSTVLVRDGEVIIRNMKKERITLADLLILLREKSIANINEVQEATIEPNGKLSIIKKKEAQSVASKDLGLWSNQGIFPTLVVDRGEVLQNNLDKLGASIDQMLTELNKKGIKDLNEIKSAWLDEEGNLNIDRNIEDEENYKIH
ncbi:MAG: DUF421 domain-containing protein [Tepidanaerobacteraceae bacterium]|nr:DUF421 domain-containing protein [Tepidanaerobacteraceae bacterium]